MRSMRNSSATTPKILAPVLRAYERRLSRCGPTPEGVFWSDQRRQQRRFVILEGIFDDAAREGGITIHDFGCGYGAFFDYLSNRSVMINSRYIGTDMCQSMINVAKNRPTDPRARFIRGFVAKVVTDYTIVSGTYNMHINASSYEWTKYIQNSLKQLWQHTRRGLAFNMLAHHVEKKYDGLYYADPRGFLNFAQKNLSSNSEIIFDPPLPDFTVFVRRT